MGTVIHLEKVFALKKKLNKMKERVLPKGRTHWSYEDELQIQIQQRVLSASVQEAKEN